MFVRSSTFRWRNQKLQRLGSSSEELRIGYEIGIQPFFWIFEIESGFCRFLKKNTDINYSKWRYPRGVRHNFGRTKSKWGASIAVDNLRPKWISDVHLHLFNQVFFRIRTTNKCQCSKWFFFSNWNCHTFVFVE